MLFTGICIVLVSVLSWWYYKSKTAEIEDKDGDDAKTIPGPNKRPLIGNLLDVDKNRLQCTLYTLMHDYGPLFRISLLSEEVVVISDAKLMEEIFQVLVDRPQTIQNELNHHCSGTSWSNLEGNQGLVKQITWQLYRETFTDPHIKQLQDEILDEFIDHLISQTDGVPDVDKVIMRSTAIQFTAEITGNTPTSEAVDASLTYLDSLTNLYCEGRSLVLTLYPWLQHLPGQYKRVVNNLTANKCRVVQLMHDLAMKSYKKGQEHGMLQKFFSRKEEENSKAGFQLIKDDNIFGSCIINVIGGGFRGTSAAISMSLLYMLLYPEMRTKLNEEVSKMRKQKKIKDIVESDLPYLNAFIFECMRMSSSIHITLTHHVDKDRTIAGYKFKKNQTVLGSVWNVHHAEKPWGDPFTLRPERFLDTSGNLVPKTHPLRQAFIPYGVGVRYCKGIETGMDKIFNYLSRILYRCEVLPIAGQDLPSGDPREFRSVVALAIPKFSCTFSERK